MVGDLRNQVVVLIQEFGMDSIEIPQFVGTEGMSPAKSFSLEGVLKEIDKENFIVHVLAGFTHESAHMCSGIANPIILLVFGHLEIRREIDRRKVVGGDTSQATLWLG